MRNLVQKTITDKNGNTSRRWVKPDEAASVSASSIPAPTTKAPKSLEEEAILQEEERLYFVDRLTVHLFSIEQSDMDLNGYAEPRISRKDLRAKLGEFEHSTLSAIKEHMPKYNDEASFVTELIFDDDYSEQSIREAMTFRDCFEEYTDAFRVASVVNGLHEYPSFGATDLSALEGKRMDSARALCKVTMAILDYLPDEKSPLSTFPATQGNRHITDKQLVGTVANNPERVDEIINLIVGREQADNWLIQNYLQNNTPLAEGVL